MCQKVIMGGVVEEKNFHTQRRIFCANPCNRGYLAVGLCESGFGIVHTPRLGSRISGMCKNGGT